MLAESDLRELVAFTTGNDPVLSVYLDTEPTNGNADVGKLRLRNMLKTINLPEDVGAVERYINLEYKWSGRGVAVFSSASRQFFRAYPLALPVRDMYHVGDRPSVQPLLDLLDNYGGYGVVLVDKQDARLFNFHLGELLEEEDVAGEQVKRVKNGGASSHRGRRGGPDGQNNTMDETIERNMREVVEAALHFFKEKNVRRVVIGGTDDNVALFRSLLPKSWQSLVAGSFAVSKNANQAEVLQRTLQVGLEAERRSEARLVENLVTASAKGEGAVIGLEQALKMLNNARVKILVLAENFHLPGYRCDTCGHLTTNPQLTCADCGGPMFKYPDIIEMAISEVLHLGGMVQIIHPQENFVQLGNVGAVLRY